jgi:uncharacterized Fe-S cluster protein YjdI
METVKQYTNGEITIVWKPMLCIHSAHCIRHLPDVFAFEKRPWVNATGSSTDQIIATIDNCPSGALSYYRNSEKL